MLVLWQVCKSQSVCVPCGSLASHKVTPASRNHQVVHRAHHLQSAPWTLTDAFVTHFR
jgi:hypothetical protein